VQRRENGTLRFWKLGEWEKHGTFSGEETRLRSERHTEILEVARSGRSMERSAGKRLATNPHNILVPLVEFSFVDWKHWNEAVRANFGAASRCV
jgi:hypothetical protein